MAPDFIAHPFGAVIAAQILEDYRFGRARPVTVFSAPALPAPPWPGTAYPRGAFDMPVIRDCEADGAQPYAEAS